MKKVLALTMVLFLALAPLGAERSERAPSAPVESALTIVLTGKILQLQNATPGDKIEVLSIVGVKIFERRIDSTNQSFMLDLPKGYYIVRIGTAVRKISVK